MPVAPTYPGVYVEEIPSGVRTITGVSTSVTAFIGYFSRGPMDEAVQIFSFGDFERRFGGLRTDSEASYAIQQFFLNGGTEAWVVRTANGATAAAIELQDSADSGTSLLLVTASSEGAWGDNLRVDVDYNTVSPTTTFNLTISEVGEVGGRQQVINSEVFRNLVIDAMSANHVVDVVNDGSQLIELAIIGTPAATDRPAQTGTVSGALPALNTLAAGVIDVQLNGAAAGQISVDPTTITTPTALGNAFQSALRTADSALSRATVEVVGSPATEQYLRVRAGTANAADILTFADDTGTLAADLGLDQAGRSNVQQYALGAAAAAGAQALPGGSQQAGSDGSLPGATELIGSEAQKTGMHALADVDIFNILCIPDTVRLADTAAAQVSTAAISFCEAERAFYILDVPHADSVRDDIDEIKQWLDDNASLRHQNVALYYPRPEIPDVLKGARLRLVAPSGTMAGNYARTDSARGIWKAPAGIEATLRGVQRLEYKLTDPENGTLNPLAINCLRSFPVYGNISWGARTLVGSDQQASEWKYVPVRRTALFLEESLYRGLHWVVFEPNDESLWAQIRLNVGAFMQNLFRQGAFQGSSPREAYFVKCDSETTTQNDINLGIVNIVVGFAPLKPAEFVIIKLQQIAGQIAV
jgi:hypothetical protein